jgi:hypothetical protein
MSRKLGALTLALAILVGAMGLKTLLTANSKGAVVMANGVSPVPPFQPPPPPPNAPGQQQPGPK